MDEQILFYLENLQGQEEEYALVTTFAFNDALYMALIPTAQDGVIHLTGYHADGEDRLIFDPVLDDALYDDVVRVFQMELEYLQGDEILHTTGALGEQEDILYGDPQGRLFYVDDRNQRQYIDDVVVDS